MAARQLVLVFFTLAMACYFCAEAASVVDPVPENAYNLQDETPDLKGENGGVVEKDDRCTLLNVHQPIEAEDGRKCKCCQMPGQRNCPPKTT